MRRREFIAALGGAMAWPLAARAQQGPKIPRIGILAPGPSEGPDATRATLNSLVAGLRELGYSEGQNIVIERAFGESNADRLRQLAAELVKRQVDVIVAFSTTAARPAKQATSVIPIVAFGMADPVEDDLVASLAKPGGNCYRDNISWPGASRQTATVAQWGRATTLPRGYPVASTCIRGSHDGWHGQRGRARRPDIGNSASICTCKQPRGYHRRILSDDRRARRCAQFVSQPDFIC